MDLFPSHLIIVDFMTTLRVFCPLLSCRANLLRAGGLGTAGDNRSLGTTGDNRGLETAGNNRGLGTAGDKRGLETAGDDADQGTAVDERGRETVVEGTLRGQGGIPREVEGVGVQAAMERSLATHVTAARGLSPHWVCGCRVCGCRVWRVVSAWS